MLHRKSTEILNDQVQNISTQHPVGKPEVCGSPVIFDHLNERVINSTLLIHFVVRLRVFTGWANQLAYNFSIFQMILFLKNDLNKPCARI